MKHSGWKILFRLYILENIRILGEQLNDNGKIDKDNSNNGTKSFCGFCKRFEYCRFKPLGYHDCQLFLSSLDGQHEI